MLQAVFYGGYLLKTYLLRFWRNASNKTTAAEDDKLSERTGPVIGMVYRRFL